MNQRVERPTFTDDEGEEVVSRPSRYAHDVLSGEQRDQIENGVAEVYRTFVWDAKADPLENEFRRQYEITKVYNAVDPKKWPLRDVGGGE